MRLNCGRQMTHTMEKLTFCHIFLKAQYHILVLKARIACSCCFENFTSLTVAVNEAWVLGGCKPRLKSCNILQESAGPPRRLLSAPFIAQNTHTRKTLIHRNHVQCWPPLLHDEVSGVTSTYTHCIICIYIVICAGLLSNKWISHTGATEIGTAVYMRLWQSMLSFYLNTSSFMDRCSNNFKHIQPDRWQPQATKKQG